MNTLKKYLPVSLHILGWLLIGFLLLFYVPLTWGVKIPAVFWIWHTLVLLIMAILFYVNAIVVVPQTILKNKIFPFVIWFVAVTVLLQVIAYLYISNTGMKERISEILNDRRRKPQLYDSFIFTTTLIVLGLSTSWSLLRNWQRSAQRHQELEQQKTEAELAMLKTQINPHFFFNTLNNIYSLTYINVEDSRKALHTLSRMMRYLLYSTEDERTTLLKEVGFLKDYISLMRLRTNEKLKLVVSMPEQVMDYPIAPMLMLPFVESAFKHGIDAATDSEIRIHLTQQNQLLELEVENNIFTKPDKQKEEGGGIGLLNTRRRLDLIYPGKYELSNGINNHGNYEINLAVELEL